MEFSDALCLNDKMQAFGAAIDRGREIFSLNFYLSHTKFFLSQMSAGAYKQQKLFYVS